MHIVANLLFMFQAITGDSVLSKFEKARIALMDSLRRVEDIVPQSIGCQVIVLLVSCYGNCRQCFWYPKV